MPPKKEAILRLFHAGVKSARRAVSLAHDMSGLINM